MFHENCECTRRDVLRDSLRWAAGAAVWPIALTPSAVALAQAGPRRDSSSRILVVLQLSGGNDGLNTVVPIGQDAYYKARPRLAIKAKDALKLDEAFGLHGALAGLKSLYDAGQLGIIHAVGYPNPNRSHFASMDIWHTGSPEGRQHTGWLGRYVERAAGRAVAPDAGIALMGDTPLAMTGKNFRPVTFQRPEDLAWKPRGPKVLEGPMQAAFDELHTPGGRGPRNADALRYLQQTSEDAQQAARRIREALRGGGGGGYPGTPVAQSLRSVSRLIAADLPTRVYCVAHTGYDTHAQQANRQNQLLSQLGAALEAFVKDLGASKSLDRVTVLVFSEFGRRVEENASGGTDHGAAGPMFIVGGRIAPGFHGQPADLTRLDRGDLAFTTDFRKVYATVLDRWLDCPAARVLGAGFEPMPLFAKS